MAGCRNVVRRGGSPPLPICIFDVSTRLEEVMMMRRVEIGHPSFWVVVMNVKCKIVKLVVDHSR